MKTDLICPVCGEQMEIERISDEYYVKCYQPKDRNYHLVELPCRKSRKSALAAAKRLLAPD